MSINDVRHEALLALVPAAAPHTNDMLMAWLESLGATAGGSLSDMWHSMCVAQGATLGTIPDMWYELLGAAGFTGSMSDRELAFWADGGTAIGVSSLFDDINPLFFLTPTIGQPGLNAVTGNEDFEFVTGAADGVAVGDGDQAVVQMSSSDKLSPVAGFGVGTFLREWDNTSKFWFMVYWNPDGATGTWQVAFQSSSATGPGYRLRMHGDGTGGGGNVGDGSTSITVTGPTPGGYGEWDQNNANCLLMQVNNEDEWVEYWSNSRVSRTTNFDRKSTAAVTFPASPEALHITPECSLDGDVMIAGGEGLLTEDQIERLMLYGRGIDWDSFNGESANYQKSWRAMPGSTTLQVVGCFTKAPNLRIYADNTRSTRGSLIASSGELTLDSQGWVKHTFTSLTADTTYQVFAEYSSGAQDRRRMRVKTLPAARDGLKIGAYGCMEFATDNALASTLDPDNRERSLQDVIYKENLDVLVCTGDDFYYDNEWITMGESGVIPTVDDFQQVHENIASRMKINQFFERIPFFAGSFSDHDYLGNDIFGDDATNMAAAQAHLTQRYGRTYPNAPTNLYYSWTTPGLTWIALDERSESEIGVQLTSSAQRQDMEDDMTAAVGRDDFIILFSELAFADGQTVAPAASWQNFTAERTDIFNRIVSAGATERVIVLCGDHHAGGVDIDGTVQGGFDTGGLCEPPTILASRFNHNSAGGGGTSIADWPDYYDVGDGHWIEILLEDNGSQLDITITPHENSTEKTAIGPRTIGGGGGEAPIPSDLTLDTTLTGDGAVGVGFNSIHSQMGGSFASVPHIDFNDDGSVILVSSLSGDRLQTFSLGTPYDLTSLATETGTAYAINNPKGGHYSDDGDIFSMDRYQFTVASYSLTTAYQMESPPTQIGSCTGANLGVAFPLAIGMTGDGNHVWAVGDATTGSRFSISMAPLSTQYDPSSYGTPIIKNIEDDFGLNGMVAHNTPKISTDGTKFYYSKSNFQLQLLEMTTPFDPSTMTYDAGHTLTTESGNQGMMLDELNGWIYVFNGSTTASAARIWIYKPAP